MSRSYRGRVFTPRWGQARLVPVKPKRYTKAEEVAYLNRVIKRANKAAGYDTAKKPTTWNYEVIIKGDTFDGQVEALTRSEARSAVKKALGISRRKRLPANLKLEKVNVENQ